MLTTGREFEIGDSIIGGPVSCAETLAIRVGTRTGNAKVHIVAWGNAKADEVARGSN